MKKKKNRVPFFLIGTIVLIMGLLITLYQLQENKLQQEAKTHTGITYTFDYRNQPVLGEKDAPVTIATFSDYKCGACGSWYQNVYPSLKKDYIDTQKAKLVSFHFAFLGPQSKLAAQVGEAIYHQNEDAFFAYHQAVFQHQADDFSTLDPLLELAAEYAKGIDLTQLKEDVENNTFQEAVEQDYNTGKAAGVTGTPSVYINGERVEGVVEDPNGGKVISSAPFDYKKIQAMIDREWEKAQ